MMLEKCRGAKAIIAWIGRCTDATLARDNRNTHRCTRTKQRQPHSSTNNPYHEHIAQRRLHYTTCLKCIP